MVLGNNSALARELTTKSPPLALSLHLHTIVCLMLGQVVTNDYGRAMGAFDSMAIALVFIVGIELGDNDILIAVSAECVLMKAALFRGCIPAGNIFMAV